MGDGGWGQGDGRFTDVQGPMVDGVDGDLWVWGEVHGEGGVG